VVDWWEETKIFNSRSSSNPIVDVVGFASLMTASQQSHLAPKEKIRKELKTYNSIATIMTRFAVLIFAFMAASASAFVVSPPTNAGTASTTSLHFKFLKDMGLEKPRYVSGVIA